MFENASKKYKSCAIRVMIATVLFIYVQTAMSGPMMNILTTNLANESGWTITQITAPVAISTLLGIVVNFILTTLMTKISPKTVVVGTLVLLAASILLMGAANSVGSYTLFYISFFISRLLYAVPNIGANLFVGNWFVRTRGQALGIVTIGAPLASATFVALTTAGIGAFGFSVTWYIFAAVILVIAFISAIIVKNHPNDIGEQPDGIAVAGEQELNRRPAPLALSQMLKSGHGWLLAVATSMLIFGLVCSASFFVPMMVMKGVPTSTYLPVLAIAAIVGIPISYGLGLLDDKIGAPKATIILCVLCALCFIGFMIASPNSLVGVILVAIGYGSLSGGVPNLTTNLQYWVFGRDHFLETYRITYTFNMIGCAFSSAYMAFFLAKDNIAGAMIGLLAMIVISAICVIIIGMTPAYDAIKENQRSL